MQTLTFNSKTELTDKTTQSVRNHSSQNTQRRETSFKNLAGSMLYDFSTLRNENLSTLKVYDDNNSKYKVEMHSSGILRKKMSENMNLKASLKLKSDIENFRKIYTRGR